MEVIRKGILSDNSGQGSIEYLLISIGALVIAGIFFYAIRDTVQEHTLSISNHYSLAKTAALYQMAVVITNNSLSRN